MTQLAEDKSAYLSEFRRFERAGGNGLTWLDDLRKTAIDRFAQVGFPGSRDEEWRHTNFAPITRVRFKPAPARHHLALDDLARFSFRDEAACELVFVNGVLASELSQTHRLPAGVRVSNLAAALTAHAKGLQPHLGRYADIQKNPFVALNTGFIQDGALVQIDRGARVALPIHLLFVSTASGQPAVVHPRVLVIANDNSEAPLVESHVGLGDGTYFSNVVSEIILGSEARLDYCRLQHETPRAYHLSTTHVRLDRASSFVSHSATLGGQITRNDLNVVLAGEGAEATINGLVVINGRQHVDNHTLLDHAAPGCPSHELYKHVLSDSATGVFRGKILVRPGAQKTDSKQTSRSLLLSDEACMNSQPALEIYADDVKCTHGSTTGPVDEEMTFYLRSRGVSLEAARHLLTYAFAADITRRVRIEPVRRYLENHMAAQHDLPQDLRITDLGRHDEQHR